MGGQVYLVPCVNIDIPERAKQSCIGSWRVVPGHTFLLPGIIGNRVEVTAFIRTIHIVQTQFCVRDGLAAVDARHIEINSDWQPLAFLN